MSPYINLPAIEAGIKVFRRTILQVIVSVFDSFPQYSFNFSSRHALRPPPAPLQAAFNSSGIGGFIFLHFAI